MLPSSKPLGYAWPPEIAELAPKDTAKDRYVKPPPVPGRLSRLGQMCRFDFTYPCHRGQNPYKPRHPWIPAGS
jgi:hypothetical protein